ncbi:FAD-binding oxidoreductase [Undibacterium griseum]|uniref:FAD-binding oxidoreductase n=1 Tax=Undibacterium griseum TaxID=2762295 RepID=A0ABR6YLK1_9BURK|nr:FAD-binding oxidoreductase [Undibacterium griseum]MBC3884787.1 FAD-binding oxidoreductase [Undibacterium griseum]
MRRWNGWGDDSVEQKLSPEALYFLAEKIGEGKPLQDADLQQVCLQVPESRLEPHILISINPAERIRHSLGQSLPDWLQLRYGRIDRVPDGVAFPENAEQVRELLNYAARHQVIVIPHGGGTSVAGHLTIPPATQPVLSISTRRMRRLLHLDRESQLATFEAGVFGPDLEAQLRAQGYTLGHFPQSFEYSTLGGWVVTRSSGQQSLRYGRIEQLFAGGRLETPAGSWYLPAFPASAAGPDLRELVLGSEGRLGILTEATVRVSRLPECEEFHGVFFPDWDSAQAAVRSMVQEKLPLSMLRLSNPLETTTSLALAGHAGLIGWLEKYLRWRGCGEQKCLLLLGASGNRATVRQTIRRAMKLAHVQRGITVGQYMGKKWKQGRFQNVYLRNTLWQQGYAIDTVETACNWPVVKQMMQAVEQAATDALAEDGERIHTYTHLSHLYAQGASVYTTFVFRLSGDYATDLARWKKMKHAVSQTIVMHGGTISHQHGVGSDHAPYLQAEKGAAGMQALRQVFSTADPQGLMNPGKLLTTPVSDGVIL